MSFWRGVQFGICADTCLTLQNFICVCVCVCKEDQLLHT